MRIAGYVALIVTLGGALGGCASVMNRPPSCDGYARRPLNKSMWDWEAGRPAAAPTGAPAASPAAGPGHVSQATVPQARREVAALAGDQPAVPHRSCG